MPRPSWLLDRRTVIRGAGLAMAVAVARSHVAGRPRRDQAARAVLRSSSATASVPSAQERRPPGLALVPAPTGPITSSPSRWRRSRTAPRLHTFSAGCRTPPAASSSGHNTVDVWLTGADIREDLNNSRVDRPGDCPPPGRQDPRSLAGAVQPRRVGTRAAARPSSFDAAGPRNSGRIELRGRSSSGSSSRRPTATSPRAEGTDVREARVDFLLEDARGLRTTLGSPDQQRLDEFLQSLDEVEGRLARAAGLARRGAAEGRPRRDQPRRVAHGADRLHPHHVRPDRAGVRDRHHAVGGVPGDAEDGVGICDQFPAILKIGRGRGPPRAEPRRRRPHARLGQVRPLPRRAVRLLPRAASPRSARATGGSWTTPWRLYGSGTSNTHNARNYPLVLAGGKTSASSTGGSSSREAERPLGDLFLTLLHRFDVPAKSFADNAAGSSARSSRRDVNRPPAREPGTRQGRFARPEHDAGFAPRLCVKYRGAIRPFLERIAVARQGILRTLLRRRHVLEPCHRSVLNSFCHHAGSRTSTHARSGYGVVF